jgi:hypothetical protein
MFLLLLGMQLQLSHSLQFPWDAPNSPKQPTTTTNRVHAAVIVPGFLTGQADFFALAKTLTNKGIPTVVVPMPVWHWIPCIGGRSVRPILERIDYTVKHVSAAVSSDGDIVVPPFQYTFCDLVMDFMDNPGGVYKVGGSDEVDEYPNNVSPRGTFPPPANQPEAKIALIGHSAGGFISRCYLSERPFGGKAYNGTKLVHSLVTLGTPHQSVPGFAFKAVEWANREPLPVRGLAVGATGSPGDTSGALTKNSYAFCTAMDGSKFDGDGLTTTESSVAMEGDCVEKLVLDGVTHYPWSDAGVWGQLFAPDLARDHKSGKPWYGDEEIVDKWYKFLLQHS